MFGCCYCWFDFLYWLFGGYCCDLLSFMLVFHGVQVVVVVWYCFIVVLLFWLCVAAFICLVGVCF